MRSYVKNILIYVVALLGLIAFIGLFSNSLEIFDKIKGSWSSYKVNAFLGEEVNGVRIYKGATLPIFGFVFPLLIAILLIVESFRHSWSGYVKVINTIVSIILFVSALFVLLTKEIFLNTNGLGESVIIRNGLGPIISAVCSFVGGVLLLFTTFFPLKQDMKFIEKQ